MSQSEILRTAQISKIAPTIREDESLAYLFYPGCPVLVDAVEAINNGVLDLDGKNIIYRPRGAESRLIGEKRISIRSENQYDLVGATLFGLNEALVRAEKGSGLRKEFDEEFARFSKLEGDYGSYGTYAYYPRSGDLVHYAPQRWHRLALVTSNSSLYLDPEMKMSWEDVRSVFDNLIVGIAGASVGNNIAHALTMDIRPRVLKIGDPHSYKMPNANRVKLGYRDMVLSERNKELMFNPTGLNNKAVGAASQIHTLDPFMQVWTYFEGVNRDNVESFIGGNMVEPALDFVVEETDDPDSKILIREMAREKRVRLFMASDLGSAVQIDIRNFDTNPNASLAVGVPDDELYTCQRMAHERVGDRAVFVKFANILIGEEYKSLGEFSRLIDGRINRLFASIPQLGSTAAMGGGILAEVMARTALGHTYPERFLINKYPLEIKQFGEIV